MQFTDIEQVKRKFRVDGTTLEEIRKQLRQLLKEVHPDTNHGSFASQEDEKKYHQIKDAISFIDEQRPKDTSIALRSEIHELLLEIRKIVPKTAQVDFERKLDTIIENDIKMFKMKHKFPKITTAVISAVISALWLFPNSIRGHPILSRFIDLQSPFFAAFWFLCLLFTASYWLVTAYQENREKQFKKYLKLETVQNQIFRDFLRFQTYKPKDESTDTVKKFEKDDLIRYIRNFESIENPILRLGKERLTIQLQRNVKLHYLGGHIDTELAQSLADTILQRILLKGVIEKDLKKSLSDIYIVKVDNENLQ